MIPKDIKCTCGQQAYYLEGIRLWQGIVGRTLVYVMCILTIVVSMLERDVLFGILVFCIATGLTIIEYIKYRLKLKSMNKVHSKACARKIAFGETYALKGWL